MLDFHGKAFSLSIIRELYGKCYLDLELRYFLILDTINKRTRPSIVAKVFFHQLVAQILEADPKDYDLLPRSFHDRRASAEHSL